MSAAEHFVNETINAANALSAAHTIVAGLSQRKYGGVAVLDSDSLARAMHKLRATAGFLELTLRFLCHRANQAADNKKHPEALRYLAKTLARDLLAATQCAGETTHVLRGLETLALHIRDAALDSDFAL